VFEEAAMDGMVGDRMVVSSRRINQADRCGEIVEVSRDPGGTAYYRVRWDDGHESVMCPGADASVHPAMSRPAAVPDQARTVMIELVITEDRELCEARASMRTTNGMFTGVGSARRNPVDPVVPMIGEELASARSLADLAIKLEDAARAAIAARESRPLHLVQ
jgi:hypothetical protein